jgi:hypothetical protein
MGRKHYIFILNLMCKYMELSNLTQDRTKAGALANTEMNMTFEVFTALKMWAV